MKKDTITSDNRRRVLNVNVGICTGTHSTLLTDTTGTRISLSTSIADLITSAESYTSSCTGDRIHARHLGLYIILETDAYVVDLGNDSLTSRAQSLDGCEISICLNLEQCAWFKWMRHFVSTEENSRYG